MHPPTLKAVIWDFDGTLADTREKNLAVTRKLVEDLKGGPASRFPMLRSVASYDAATMRAVNWRQLYSRELGLAGDEIDLAGSRWDHYQSRDDTPTPIFDGIPEVIRALGAQRHAIVSMNARDNIERTLRQTGLDGLFEHVIGYQEVGSARQKPAPDGLLMSIETLVGKGPAQVLYVGDHSVDILCARNADRALEEAGTSIRVTSIGVRYGHPAEDETRRWETLPDHQVGEPQGILSVVAGLLRPGDDS